jgi:tetratricopeptide (TPR) repeat protein
MKITFATVIISIAVFCSSYAAERPINELPMYGGQHNPAVETDKENSKSAAKLGWKYYYSGDFDTAIKRFNQAWMLDRENADAFYGFGLILGQRAREEETEKNLLESIKFLEKANSLSPQNVRIMVDFAFSHTLLGNYLLIKKKSAKDEFKKARFLFFQAEKIEPKYPLIYLNWSVLEFYDGNYFLAKRFLDHAKKLGATPDLAYERELESKVQIGTAEEREAKETAELNKSYRARVEAKKEEDAKQMQSRMDANRANNDADRVK